MASSPERISSGASATAATARRPMASLTLASTSAGPAVCKITSSTPHSALTAARPPSVTIAKSGQSRPVVCKSRQMLLACASSRRASISTASAGGASTRADASAGSTRTGCSRSPRAGRTSADGSSTLVISSRSLTRRHLHSLVRLHLTTCINRQGPGGNSAQVPLPRRISHMAKVTIQYWAAAREAAGVDLESVEAQTLAEALDVIVARRADDGRLRSVLATSSFLVDGASAGRSVAADLVLNEKAVIEVLPQFAGGLRGPRARGVQ